MHPARLELTGRAGALAMVDGRVLDSYAGCDYLGLSRHPEVLAALASGAREYGLSAAASRETTGATREHRLLEEALADFLGVEAVLLVPDGYLTNLAAAQGLAPEHAAAWVDALAHASVRDGAQTSGLAVHRFAHRDAGALADALAAADRPLVMTDGVFPTEGTTAPLPALLAALPDDGRLLVDDAHGLGVLGPRGQGTLAHHGLRDPRVVLTGTLSKAFGCAGGVIAGTAAVVTAVRERARAYVGATALAPALARAGRASLRVHRSEPALLATLHRNIARLRALFAELGWPVPAERLPVFTFRLDPPERMGHLSAWLLERGVLAPCVRYLAAPGAATLRWTVTADHTGAQLDRLAELLCAFR